MHVDSHLTAMQKAQVIEGNSSMVRNAWKILALLAVVVPSAPNQAADRTLAIDFE
jgi:hypothetical protein